jgi:molecular chaperone GrpE
VSAIKVKPDGKKRGKKEIPISEDPSSTVDISAGAMESVKTPANEQEEEQASLAIEEGKAKLEDIEKEKQEIYEHLLRTTADFENHKKRVQREKEDLLRYGNQKFALEILPVIDNFERALQQAEGTSDKESMLQGIEMILKQLLQALEKFGIKGFSSIGEPFDPHKHEAMSHQESVKHEENTVISEFQKGYFLHDRLLRPALVVVSKRPTEAEKSLGDAENIVDESAIDNETVH